MNTPAGWYPDPSNTLQQRCWDGRQWTENVQPAPDNPGPHVGTANTGDSNFVVIGYGSSFPQLAVNEIGSYQGTVQLSGPAFVQVESDGAWTITPQ